MNAYTYILRYTYQYKNIYIHAQNVFCVRGHLHTQIRA